MHWLLFAIAGYFLYPLALKPTAVKLASRLPPAREAMFKHAMKCTDPAKLADYADAFKAEGFKKESDQLRARANLRAHPKDTLDKYAEILKRALSSTNVQAVEDVAEAFRNDGAGSIADLLDEYAAGMNTLKSVPPVVVPAHMLAPVATPELPAPPTASPPGAPSVPAAGAATVNGESVYVPPGVPPETLALLGVHGAPPPSPNQYDPLSGKSPYQADPGNMPDNRPLGVPPGNNPFQSNGQPGIGLPGVMPQRQM
jgi:hypothetical protein